jgi:alpha-glucosidase
VVGEVNLSDTAAIARYHGAGDELHLAFHFGLLDAPWSAGAWRSVIAEVEEVYRPIDAWPAWVLSNHDQPRHHTRYGDEARARAAAVALLGLRGTPFLYQGEELGLEDADVPPDRVVDPGGRDGCRAPVPWTAAADHGWAGEPWLPWPPEPDRRNAAAQAADPRSVLALYRRLLAARRASPALRAGDLELLDAGDDVVAWRRRAAGDERVVVVGMGPAPATVPLDGAWVVEVASDDPAAAGTPFAGAVGPDTAVLLRPA